MDMAAILLNDVETFEQIELVRQKAQDYIWWKLVKLFQRRRPSQLAFYVNLHRAVIGPSATLTGRWRPDIDLRRMLTGFKDYEIFSMYVAKRQGQIILGTKVWL